MAKDRSNAPTEIEVDEAGADMPKVDAEATTTFGKYRLFASLGSGGMAEVYLAVARGPMGFNKLAVVKRLRSNLASCDPNFVKMFIDEARLAARLNHPNIVYTYEIGEQDGAFFIAMEYLEGQSLRRVVSDAARRGQALSAQMAVRIAADALAGLHHAHELKDYNGAPLGVIHRDVSPHNIFVTYEGQIKIVDFGIAKASLNSTQTETGILKGKAGYMAPEQAVAGEVDRRADVFEMGIVLWEMLTMTRLFSGDTVQALHKLMTMPIPRVSSVIETIDPELDAIVEKALTRKLEDRYQTAEEFRVALEAFAKKREGAVSTAEVGRFVSETFKDVRKEIARLIEEQMARIATDAATSLLSLSASNPSITNERDMTPSRMVAPPASASGRTVPSASVSILAAAQPARKSRAPLYAAALALLVVIALIGFRAGRSGQPVAAVAASLPPAVHVEATAPQPAATTTYVTIVSDPGGAFVQWNGRGFGAAPVTIELPPGPQTLTLAKEGFDMSTVVVDVPQTRGEPFLRNVALKSKAHPAAPAAAAAPRSRTVLAAAAPPPKPAPEPPPAAAPPPKAPPHPTVKVIDEGESKPRMQVLQ